MASENNDPEVVEKERRVLELRRAGYTFDDIAKTVGYASPSGAFYALSRALKRTLQQPANELREMETDRLDRLQAAVWPKALAGDNKAVDTILKIMDRRARLLGLDAPSKMQVETTTYDPGSIDAEVAKLRLILESHSGEPGVLD
jgi:hypothetical protein